MKLRVMGGVRTLSIATVVVLAGGLATPAYAQELSMLSAEQPSEQPSAPEPDPVAELPAETEAPPDTEPPAAPEETTSTPAPGPGDSAPPTEDVPLSRPEIEEPRSGEVKISEDASSVTFRSANGTYRTVFDGTVTDEAAKSGQKIDVPLLSICNISSAQPSTPACATGSAPTAVYPKIGRDASGVHRTLVKLGTPLPASAVIIGATAGYGTNLPIGAYRVTHSWNTTQATWSSAANGTPWTPGGTFDTSTPAYNSPGFRSSYGYVDFTQLAKDWHKGVTPNDGLLLKLTDEAVTGVTTHALRIEIIWQPRYGQRPTDSMQNRALSDRLTIGLNPTMGNVAISGTAFATAGIGHGLNLKYSINSDGEFGSNFLAADTRLYFDSSAPNLPWTSSSFEVMSTEGDGWMNRFMRTSAGWAPPPGVNATVTQTASALEIRYNETGLTYRYPLDGGSPPNKLSAVVDTDGNTVSYGYTSNLTSTITDTQGRQFNVTYAGTSVWPATITDVAGSRTVTFTFDSGVPIKRLLSVADADNKTTTFTYVTAGIDRLSSVTEHDGDRVTFTHTIESPSYGTVKLSNATFGAGSAAPSTYAFIYSPASTAMRDPGGGTTTFAYDTENRVTSVTDPLGHASSTSWSTLNKPSTYTDALSGITTYSYDSLGNLTGITSPGPVGTQTSRTFTYTTPSGTLKDFRPSTATDAQGNTTTYSYNSKYQLASEASAGGVGGTRTNRYQGDPGISCPNARPGQLCSTVNGNGAVTSYAYDSGGNLATITPPAPLGTTTMTYDSVGRVATKTDRRGTTLHYTYDAIDRIVKVSTNSRTCPTSSCITYTYAADGLPTKRVDPSGTTTYEFDAQDQPTTMNTPTANTSYTYDLNGNLASYTDPGGTVSYRYDAANRVTAMWDTGGSCPTTPVFPNATRCTGFSYDDGNRRTGTSYPNGQIITNAYDAAGKQTGVLAKNASAATLASRTYNYEKAGVSTGLRQSVTDQAGTTTSYTYDAMNRVLSATTGANAQSWTYDANSNRLTATKNGVTTAAKYNAADQLCYTAATNTAACGSAPAGATVYSYTGSGGITTASSGAITAATYSAFDQTASTTSGGTTTTHTYSDISSDQRTQSGSTTFTNGLLGVTRQTSSSGSVRFLRDPNGTLIAMRTASDTYYVTADAIGSTILLTDSAGTNAGEYVYDTWGAITNTLTSAAQTNPFRFASGYTDPNGLTKFGTRYYNPDLGRFTQTDPSGHERNAYAYAGCNPINNADPTGLSCASAIFTGVLGAVGLAASVIGLIAGAPTLFLGGVAAVGFIASITGVVYSVGEVINSCG